MSKTNFVQTIAKVLGQDSKGMETLLRTRLQEVTEEKNSIEEILSAMNGTPAKTAAAPAKTTIRTSTPVTPRSRKGTRVLHNGLQAAILECVKAADHPLNYNEITNRLAARFNATTNGKRVKLQRSIAGLVKLLTDNKRLERVMSDGKYIYSSR